MIHNKQSELANVTVKIDKDSPGIGGEEILIEDWWDRVSGKSWMSSDGNPASLSYAVRVSMARKKRIPNDDEVLYGKINGLGYLVHISEIKKQ